MAFYQIKTQAYFCTRDNAERPANSLLVNGEASRDKHLAQIANAGCEHFTVTELTATEYRAIALARLANG